MTNFESGVFHNRRRFQSGDEVGERYVSILIADKSLMKEVRRGHTRRKSSGDQISHERAQISMTCEG